MRADSYKYSAFLEIHTVINTIQYCLTAVLPLCIKLGPLTSLSLDVVVLYPDL
jgi:hypothetical protein